MEISIQPNRKDWPALLQRPVLQQAQLEEKVKQVLSAVKVRGDEALIEFTKQFDGLQLPSIRVTEEEITIAFNNIDADVKESLVVAKGNIETFHKEQVVNEQVVTTMPGVRCWRRSVAIEKVGLYVPGGTAPLFSTVLMLAIPAAIAGCREIVLCTPPQKDGSVHPAVLVAAKLSGVTQVYKVGGAQAIAAMAYGTATIPKVYKIMGPGNQYVTCAKQLIQQEGLAIDMPAGPSEVCVLADETANPAFVAADLLSQAEHGIDSQVLLVATSEIFVKAVQAELDKQLNDLPRKEIAIQALKNSRAIVLQDMVEAVDLVNDYAAEHLIICCKEAEVIGERIINAGSVFLGNYSPESVGDYASGTNHTLPTNGYAKMYSGVSIDSFVKKITYQQLSKEGLQLISKTVVTMAEEEGLTAHANAIRVRLVEEKTK